MKLAKTKIPPDFPVRPTSRAAARDPVTCGECGLTWDDAVVTGMTPAPSGRCPFEYFHEYKTSRKNKRRASSAT